MQRQTIAFTVLDQRTETVRPDRMGVFDDCAAVCGDFSDSVTDTTVDIQIEQDPLVGSDLGRFRHQAPAVTVFVFEDRKSEIFELRFADVDCEYFRIKRDRTIEIDNRNIEPDGTIVLRIEKKMFLGKIPSSNSFL